MYAHRGSTNKDKQIKKALVLTYLKNPIIMEKIIRHAMEDVGYSSYLGEDESNKIAYLDDIKEEIFRNVNPFCSTKIDKSLKDEIHDKFSKILVQMEKDGLITLSSLNYSEDIFGINISEITWNGDLTELRDT